MDSNTNKVLQIFLKVASIFLSVSLLAVLVVAIATYKSVSSVNAYSNTIDVSGVGTVQAVPDIARITFGHSEEAEELSDAQKELESVISVSVESLKEFGISDKDISQQSYNSYPRYEYQQNCTGVRCMDGNRVLVGYQVDQTIEVVVRDIDQAGEVLALLGGSGVTRLNGPYFEIEDMSVYEQEARTQAIENARKEAKIVAKDLGVRLGKMVDFYENSYGGTPYPQMRAVAYDMAVEESVFNEVTIPVEEDEVQVQVTLVFKIK